MEGTGGDINTGGRNDANGHTYMDGEVGDENAGTCLLSINLDEQKTIHWEAALQEVLRMGHTTKGKNNKATLLSLFKS